MVAAGGVPAHGHGEHGAGQPQQQDLLLRSVLSWIVFVSSYSVTEIIAGGCGDGSQIFDDILEFDIKQENWTKIGKIKQKRCNFGISVLSWDGSWDNICE